MPRKVIVIGAGFGGIGAAIRLAARGYDVTIVEKRDAPGGRAYVYRRDGFTFDGGPTVITAPWLIRDLFTCAGEQMEDHLTLVPIDPFYRIFFPEGNSFDYTGDSSLMEQRIRELTGSEADVTGYQRFLDTSRKIFDIGFTELADKPFLRFSDMMRVLPSLMRLKSFQSVYGMVSNHVANEQLRQVLSFHTLLVGGNPFTTTSIYALIHHLEREWGVWFALGGTAAVVDSLMALFARLGGSVHYSTEIETIAIEHGRVTGVRTIEGMEFPADIVVCNADIGRAVQSMLPAKSRRTLLNARMPHMRSSMSLVVIYFGTDRTYRDAPGNRLAHHNIIFGPRYRELLTDVFDRKVLAEDFSLYLHMPTFTDASLAPAGGETFYVLAPVPHLGGQVNWEVSAVPFRDRIMAHLEKEFLPDLSKHIITEHRIDPRHFESELGSHLGSAFSFEPILTQSAWFRPHNKSSSVSSLYFVGAGTHPGAGLPGVLTSAKIADDLIAANHG